MKASLYRLRVPSCFGGSAGFDMHRSHVLPQGVLAAVTLVGGIAVDGRASSRTRCEAGLPLRSSLSPPYKVGVRCLVAGAEVLRVGSKLALFPIMCAPSPPTPALSPRRKQCRSKRGPCGLSACDEVWAASEASAGDAPVTAAPALHRQHSVSEPPPSLTADLTLHLAGPVPVRAALQGGPRVLLACVRAQAVAVWPPSRWAASDAPPV